MKEGVIILTEYVSGHQAVNPKDIKHHGGEDGWGAAGSFGKFEVEAAAGLLLSFFQEMGRFGPFSLDDYAEFLKKRHKTLEQGLFGLMGACLDDSWIGGLREPETYLVSLGDNRTAPTNLLVKKMMENPR